MVLNPRLIGMVLKIGNFSVFVQFLLFCGFPPLHNMLNLLYFPELVLKLIVVVHCVELEESTVCEILIQAFKKEWRPLSHVVLFSRI